MAKLILKKSSSKSDALDADSIQLLRNFFYKNNVKERLELGGNLPMIDGYLELLDSDEVMEAKITVQVKHLTHLPKGPDAFYDIPNSIFAYANLNKGEVVIFVACDTVNEIFYWRYIDSKAIQDFMDIPKESQKTQRYHFERFESCKRENLMQTIEQWKKIFAEKMSSFVDKTLLAENFANNHRSVFSTVHSLFSDLTNSHIKRHEVDELVNWSIAPANENKCNLCILQGNAGVGKSVVIKDFVQRLEEQQVKTLCIKADCLNLMSEDMGLDKLIGHIQYLKSNQRLLVVVIDQIDALSQYLSNDREMISLFVNLILSLKDYHDIKIVVSCRKYDLEYDVNLRFLSCNAYLVDLGKLSVSDVKRTLNILKNGLGEQLDNDIIGLLQTAYLLNLFCLLYRRNRRIARFRNAHQLYDEFWKSLVNNVPPTLKAHHVESILFTIAESAHRQKTLAPLVSVDAAGENVLVYLASNGAVVKINGGYSFFHQSFYDYTLARFYTQTRGGFFEQLKNDFQGFEIRSVVKAIFDYEREHDLNRYAGDLRLIFNSPQIRMHIKLLAISLIATSDTVYDCERDLVFELCYANETYLSFFLRGIHQDLWFTTLRSIVLPKIEKLNLQADLLNPIANFLSCASFRHSKEVFDSINQNNEDAVRNYLINSVLRGHNDYRRLFVREALLSSSLDSELFVYALLDALQTNSKFVFVETEKLILNYLLRDKKKGNRNDVDVLVDELCVKLANEYPKEYTHLFQRCFIEVIRKNGTPNCHMGLTRNDILGHDVEGYDLRLLNLYKKSLVKFSADVWMIHPIIKELLSTKNESALCVAFEIMALNPTAYDKEILDILDDLHTMDSFLQGEIEYYWLSLLHNWYLVQNSRQKALYELFLINYKSESDFYTNKHRTLGERLYPFLGYNKWKLVSATIPDYIENIDIRKCRQELNRRFGNEPYLLKKFDNGVQAAEFCGGVMSHESFSKLSLVNWINIFAMDGRRHYNRKPIDLRINAGQFKECVCKNINRFSPFVFGLFRNDNILAMYRIAGLKGLLEGGIELHTTWPYAKQFMMIDFVKSNPHDFFEIMKYYIKNDNVFIDELVPFLMFAVMQKDEGDVSSLCARNPDKFENTVNTMLTKALNSYQGRCAELLVGLCGIESRREYGYALLNGIESRLSKDVRLYIAYCIFDKRYFDFDLTKSTFFVYLKRLGVDALLVCAKAIQYYWYNNQDVVREYIERIEIDVRAHEVLAQIYFYGLSITDRGGECENRLEKLLVSDNVSVIAIIIELCLKNFSQDEYNTFCRRYLKRFSLDRREEIIHTYCYYAKELPIEAFDFFLEIYTQVKSSKFRDDLDKLKYIKKCVVQYPHECMDFVLAQEYETAGHPHLFNKKILDVLLMIYKHLKEERDLEKMNCLMDYFENLIYHRDSSIMKIIDDYK